jgi:uncharacterized delta-60 repeat protein
MNSFGHGDIVYYGDKNENTLYPLMFVTPLQFTYDENTTQVNLSIIFGDIVNTDLSNQTDVVSDMSLAARDFLSQISNFGGSFYDYFDVVVPVISSTFIERFNDHVGGVALDINIIYLEDINACDQYEPIPSPSITPSVTSTPSVTPSVTSTPSVTPSLTPTNSVTPSVTPSVTSNVTPSITPTSSVTPSVTPSLTPTPTPTPPLPQKLLIGGNFTSFNGNTRNRLLRLNSDGTEDTAFYTNLGTAFNDCCVNSSNVQSDGKLLIGGGFTSFNGNTRNRLLRLNSNGTEDTAFYTNLGTSFNNIAGPAVQSDGKILVSGLFTSFNGNTRNRLLRLNSNGTEDTAFYTNLGTAFDDSASVAGIQSDGKILIVGNFTLFNGNSRTQLIRLNSNGTEDTAFYTNLGTRFSSILPAYCIPSIQSDGKILIGGRFNTFNGNTRNNFLRLNSDGTEDTAFYTNLGTAFGNNVNSAAVQSDGKIVVGGQFTSFNGNTRNYLVRLNSDGTEDTSFYTNLGTGFNDAVAGIIIQSDGKIIILGDFTLFNGNTRYEIIRLNSDGTEDTSFYTNLGTGFGLVPSLSLNVSLS